MGALDRIALDGETLAQEFLGDLGVLARVAGRLIRVEVGAESDSPSDPPAPHQRHRLTGHRQIPDWTRRP